MSQTVTTVPFKMAHTDKHEYIGSFPEQLKPEEGPGVVPQKQRILDHLRKELHLLTVQPKAMQDYVCFRNCFKWEKRDFVDFCLERQCGNPGFEAAATHLGLLRQ